MESGGGRQAEVKGQLANRASHYAETDRRPIQIYTQARSLVGLDEFVSIRYDVSIHFWRVRKRKRKGSILFAFIFLFELFFT